MRICSLHHKYVLVLCVSGVLFVCGVSDGFIIWLFSLASFPAIVPALALIVIELLPVPGIHLRQTLYRAIARSECQF